MKELIQNEIPSATTTGPEIHIIKPWQKDNLLSPQFPFFKKRNAKNGHAINWGALITALFDFHRRERVPSKINQPPLLLDYSFRCFAGRKRGHAEYAYN